MQGRRCPDKSPCGVSSSPPHFSNSAFATRRNWLRILLRATPEDPTEQERTMARSTRAHGATLRIEVRITEEEKAINQRPGQQCEPDDEEYIRRTALQQANPFDDGPEGAGGLARLGGLQSICSRRSKSPDEEGLRKGLNSTLLLFITQ